MQLWLYSGNTDLQDISIEVVFPNYCGIPLKNSNATVEQETSANL